MARSLFRGAPELSRLFVEAPIELVSEFLSHLQFSVFLAEAMTEVRDDAEEQVRRASTAAVLGNLKADRTNLIEVEARRVMLMADKTPEAILRRLGEDRRFSATQGLKAQRDAIARSLWAYLRAFPLFEAAERAMQVQVYRDHGKLYEAWSIDASIPLTAEGVDHHALSDEIADRLQHEDGCKVEAIDLPAENGESQDVLISVTFFGAYASQKTVLPDKSTEILYFRPPDEMLLVYSHELGDVVHYVDRDSTSEKATLALVEGGSGLQVPVEDVTRYEIRFDYLRDALRDVLKPMGLKGRVREVANHLHQVGVAQIGLATAPIYLARALSDDKLLEASDRLIRGESNRIRGIIFVPQDFRFPYIGCHVVLSLKDHIDEATGLIDAEAVRIAYEAAIDPAARGTAVHFWKLGDEAAQITVPGQDPRLVTGPKKVKLFERLYMAHGNREPGVKLAILKDYAGFSQLPQLFGDEWAEVNQRYLYSPRRAYWALCGEPISA